MAEPVATAKEVREEWVREPAAGQEREARAAPVAEATAPGVSGEVDLVVIGPPHAGLHRRVHRPRQWLSRRVRPNEDKS
jgi:hypothetical protein